MKVLHVLALLLVMTFGFAANLQAQCSVSFTSTTTPNGTSFVSTTSGFSGFFGAPSYFWNFGNGTTSNLANPAMTFASGFYTVCLTVSDSACTATYCDSIYVQNSACAGFSASASQSVNGNVATFTSTVTGGTAPYAYSWNFGDGSALSNTANPTHTYINGGTYNAYLTVIDANGCAYTDYAQVVINTPCTGNNATLTLNFDNYATETSWDIRNANNAVVASGSGYSYNQNGTTLNIPLCLATGCYSLNVYDSYGDGMCCLYGNGSYTLTSGGAVLASGGAFAYNTTTTVCVGGATNPCANATAFYTYTNNNGVVQFVATSNAASPQYLWNFGDGTTGTGASASHTYANATASGFYVVCVTVYDSMGCSATYCDSIAIAPQPCANNTVILTLNFDNFAYETSWNLTDANNNIVYSGGNYSVNQNGTTLSLNLCLPNGCYNFNINDSYGDGMCCAWGNGSYSLVDANGSLLASGGAFNSSQTTNICVGGATNPCSYFYNNTFTYTVNPNGVVTFTPQTGGVQSPLNYSWNFGNGITSTLYNPTITFPSNGIYQVCLTADSAACSTVYCANVAVGTNSNNPSGCNGLSLNMNITQDPNNPFNLLMQPVVNNAPINAAFDFVWDFGDNTGTFFGYPSHQYSNFGSYIVCVTAIDSMNGCVETFCDTITIDSSGNFSRTVDYKDVKPGFTATTQTAIVNYVTAVTTIATEGLEMELFPNPANEYINLAIHSTENINGTVTILDATGKTLYENTVTLGAGRQQITLPTNKLVSGLYLVKMTSDNAQQTMKFVKE